MPITAADWKKLSPLLDEALDLPPAQRAAWLAALPPRHADLREQLAALLAGGRAIETGDFLDRLPEFSATPAALSLGPGSVVGPYRLLSELGSGGTSTVWLAERADGSIQRHVALKLPHLGLVDRGIAERIARERDILASLEHPSIARLYDAGIDERGRPYLALEYVAGQPPDEYCRRERLSIRERLKIFLEILCTVSFAHARLVVHRDLKPSNIQIAKGGDVRLLDFGIARLLQGESAVGAAHTLVGQVALTPAYAAPEQFTGQPITVATDVYSLGVILFEMLTGASPYSPKGQSLGAYEHEVLHVEPPLMSRVARPADVSALRGDLDAIVAKALEKSPGDRYVSADAFAVDIERFMAAQPISARPRSFSYVARKFLRRNAWPLVIGAAFVVLLSAALGFAGWQWRDAERQRAMAVERLAVANASEEFTSTVLIENIQPGQSLSFEELIARSEQIARDTGANDLRTRIYATEFLSAWYSANGLYRDAERVISNTLDSLPEDQPMLGATLRCRRARLWDELGTHEDAIAILDAQIALADGDDAIASRCLLDRSAVASTNADAPGALAFALEAQRRYELAGVDSVFDRANILVLIGGAYGITGEFHEANAQYAETLRLYDSAGRGNSRAAAALRDDWSSIWMNSGNPRRALEELDLGWAIFRKLSPAALDDDYRLQRRGRLLAQLGQYDGALMELKRAAELAEPRGNLANVASIRIARAEARVPAGQLAQAGLDLDAATVAMRQANMSPTNLIVIRHLAQRADWLAARGDTDDALSAYSRALSLYESQKCCRATRAYLLARRSLLELDRDPAAAAADAASARELAPEVESDMFSRFTGLAWYATGRVHEQRRQWREARDAYAQSAVQFAGSVGDTHPDTLRSRDAMSRLAERISTENHH